MPAASATKPAPAFGLTAKIFLASTLLVVAVLGITLGVTSIEAHRTADASIHRALLATRRAVDDYLAARTRTLGRASTVATDVPQYRQRLLNERARSEALDQADDIRGLVDAAWVLVTNSEGILIARTDYREQYDRDLSIAPLVANALAADTGGEGMPLATAMGNQHLIGLAGAIRSPSGDVRGGFVALRSRESELAAFNALQRTMLWAVALGVVLALIFAFVQARQIAGPVRRLAVATRQVQEGDYGVGIDRTSRGGIGILSQAVKAPVADLKAK